jgi:uncharacterized membrane protein
MLLSSYIKKEAPNPARDAARAELMKKYGGGAELTDEQRTQMRTELRASTSSTRASWPRLPMPSTISTTS